MALTRTIERSQQLETAWHGVARRLDYHADAHRQRGRGIDMIACAVSVIGLVAIIASQFYRLVPYEYAFTLTLIGVVLATAPLILAFWPSVKDSGPGGRALESSARARANAAHGKRLTQALELSRVRETWTDETRKTFEGLLDGMEADVARSIKDLGLTGIEGRKHRRIVPRQRKVVVQTRVGRSLTGHIADISISGVALSDQLPRVAVKDEVLINGRAATIVRIWGAGVALEFKQHLKAEMLNEDLVL